MFQSSKRDATAAAPAVAATSARRNGSGTGLFSVLGPDVTVTGNIAAAADLHLDGRVEGDIACAVLTQGADSVVHGGITAESARIAGTVDGTVRVRQLTVERTARITGDVEYETITIEGGGQIDGGLRRVTSLTVTPVATGLLPRIAEVDTPAAS